MSRKSHEAACFNKCHFVLDISFNWSQKFLYCVFPATCRAISSIDMKRFVFNFRLEKYAFLTISSCTPIISDGLRKWCISIKMWFLYYLKKLFVSHMLLVSNFENRQLNFTILYQKMCSFVYMYIRCNHPVSCVK